MALNVVRNKQNHMLKVLSVFSSHENHYFVDSYCRKNQHLFSVCNHDAKQFPKFKEFIKSNQFSLNHYYLNENKNSKESLSKLDGDINNEVPKKSTQAAKLAKVFAEYGAIGVVFHTSISLTSLGLSYLVVSSGVDVLALMQKLNLITEVTTEAKMAGGASTFVIAYALHKVFMPVRIFITVSCTPLIVKKLRRLGFLKKPLGKKQTDRE